MAVPLNAYDPAAWDDFSGPGVSGEAPGQDPAAAVAEVPPQADYRATPSLGQHGDPLYRPDSYHRPNGAPAVHVPPQPRLPFAGYTQNNENVQPNQLQPDPPAYPQPVYQPPSWSIGQYDYDETT